ILCFDLSVDFEALRGDTKAVKVKELVEHISRQNRLQELITVCNELRPHFKWELDNTLTDKTNFATVPVTFPKRKSKALPVQLRVFMSYKREDLSEVQGIERVLHANGIRLWRDLDYLPLGTDVEEEVRNAINNECSGFLVYITERALASDFIWRVEIPEAYAKSKRSKGYFPLIPVFQNEGLLKAFSEKSFDLLGIDLSLRNGVVLNGDPKKGGQQLASKLLRDLIARSPYNPIEIFTYGPIPTTPPNHIILDWRHYFGNGHPYIGDWQEIIIPALQNLKRALLKKDKPQREIWLPSRIHLSAGLVYGWVFRRTTGFQLVASDSLKLENPEDIIDETKFTRFDFSVEKGQFDHHNLAFGICVAKDVNETILRTVQQHGYRYGTKSIGSLPMLGATSILNTSHARFLADQAVEHLLSVKKKYRTETTDIFLSSSVQFAAHLGWHLNACGDFKYWQYHNQTGCYNPLFELSDIFDTDT
ncbi:SAVED domain-containing protein, partial [candidate division WWE3 bacterium]|nr:SAVED domain-containing protein [candidate division WWE3 bacterium]